MATVKPTQVKVNEAVNNAAYKKPTNNATYNQLDFASKYADQITGALDKVTNRQEFKYNPVEDANYQALARIYNANGEKAAKNSLGDAAALNGGYSSSYAISAAQQARNDYNQQLAAMIPELERNAYGKYKDNYDMDVTALNALRDAENTDYGRYRDTVGDNQWKYGVDYQKYRDDVGDAQWKYGVDYQKYRDDVSDSQWAKSFNESAREWAEDFNQNAMQWAKEFAESQKMNAVNRANTIANTNYTKKQTKLLGKSSGGSGGGGRSGGGNSSSSSSSSSSQDDGLSNVVNAAGNIVKALLGNGGGGNSGGGGKSGSGGKTGGGGKTTDKSSSNKKKESAADKKKKAAAYKKMSSKKINYYSTHANKGNRGK